MPDPTPKLRWFQFRLRTLLVVVTLCAVACSWVAVKMWQREPIPARVTSPPDPYDFNKLNELVAVVKARKNVQHLEKLTAGLSNGCWVKEEWCVATVDYNDVVRNADSTFTVKLVATTHRLLFGPKGRLSGRHHPCPPRHGQTLTVNWISR